MSVKSNSLKEVQFSVHNVSDGSLNSVDNVLVVVSITDFSLLENCIIKNLDGTVFIFHEVQSDDFVLPSDYYVLKSYHLHWDSNSSIFTEETVNLSTTKTISENSIPEIFYKIEKLLSNVSLFADAC